MEVFTHSDSDRGLYRWIAIGFMGFALLPLALFLFPGSTPADRAEALRITAMAAPLGVVLSLLSYRQYRLLRSGGVALDDEGIWSGETTREAGLIPWTRIVGVKEPPMASRLDLIGEDGRPVLSIHHAVDDLERLRQILVDRIGHAGTPAVPATFAKPLGYHVVMNVLSFGPLGATLAVTADIGAIAIAGAWCALFLGLYLFSAYRILVTAGRVEIRGFLASRVIATNGIASVRLADVTLRRAGHFAMVELDVEGAAEPVRLERVRDTLQLYRTLRHVVEVAQRNEAAVKAALRRP